MLDQALLAEQAQRLAQRSPAGTETAGELFFDQPLTGQERTAEVSLRSRCIASSTRLDGASAPFPTRSG